jgi:hypothetical protein
MRDSDIVPGDAHERRRHQRGLALAAISGARTFLGPALAVRRLGAGRGLRRLTTLLAAFEIGCFDKLPGVGARTAAPQLLGRLVSGATVAVALRPRGRRSGLAAALAWAAVAGASAFATLRLRYALMRLPFPRRLRGALSGVVEDLALLALGSALARPAPHPGDR